MDVNLFRQAGTEPLPAETLRSPIAQGPRWAYQIAGNPHNHP